MVDRPSKAKSSAKFSKASRVEVRTQCSCCAVFTTKAFAELKSTRKIVRSKEGEGDIVERDTEYSQMFKKSDNRESNGGCVCICPSLTFPSVPIMVLRVEPVVNCP